MPVEFISVSFANASNEINPLPGAAVDPDFLVRYARVLDDYGYNNTLLPYDSGGFDPFTLGATILAVTKNINIIIALRPNTLYPTVAAKALATLDQLGKGRVIVHFIAGGSDAEQAKEGDFLTKEQRYGRLEEYIRILRRAWESADPFDWDGQYYQFKQFSSRVRPTRGTIPVSVGGSSDDAYRIGGSLADIFGLWGEPLKETKAQIDRIYAEAKKAGRPEGDRPRIWVTFRPIIAETDELAWAKAHRYLDILNDNRAKGQGKVPANAPPPQNVGSQRLLEIAKRGEVQDRALWYPTVTATNARGASTALVGSAKTIQDSLLDYVDLGCELLSIRGYENFDDAVDYGRYVIPQVRKELDARASHTNGTNGTNGVTESNGANGIHEATETNGSSEIKPEVEAKPGTETNGASEIKPATENKPVTEANEASEATPKTEITQASENKLATAIKPETETEVKPEAETNATTETSAAVGT